MGIFVKDGMVYLEESGEKDVPDGRYLSLEEYGKRHEIKNKTLRVMIHRGQIPSIKLLGKRYIPEEFY